jgi:hypothetical protein
MAAPEYLFEERNLNGLLIFLQHSHLARLLILLNFQTLLLSNGNEGCW